MSNNIWLLEAYEEYCHTHLIESAEKLLKAIIYNQHKNIDHEIIKIWNKRKKPNNSITLNTSGTTTGQARRYKFGPLANFWLYKIEKVIKHDKGSRPILLRNMMNSSIIEFRQSHRLEQHYSYDIGLPNCNDTAISDLINLLKQIPSTDLKLTAHPHVWLALTNNKIFCEYIIEHKSKISLSSTNSEAFYKKTHLIENNVIINDNMVNWQTGLNFWTCEYGNKHSLKLFTTIERQLNILNLEETDITNDDLYIETKEKCYCGKEIIYFIPHTTTQPQQHNKLLYNLKLAEQLTGYYENLQFIEQEQEKIEILYKGTITESDRDLFNKIIKSPTLIENHQLIINTKKPTFYRNINKLEKTKIYKISEYV